MCRSVFFVDSQIDESLYYYLCVNLREELKQEYFSLDWSSMASFEQFYFTHKDDIEITCFVADRLLTSYLGLFAVLFHLKAPDEMIMMNRIVENVYLSRPIEDNKKLVSDFDPDLMLSYINAIEKELSYQDEEGITNNLSSVCRELSNMIISSQSLEYPPKSFADNSIVVFGYRELVTMIEKWLKDDDYYMFYRKTNRSYDSIVNSRVIEGIHWENNETLLEGLNSFGDKMVELIRRVSYEYDSLDAQEINEFTSFWPFMLAIQFNGIIPSTFYDRAVRITL